MAKIKQPGLPDAGAPLEGQSDATSDLPDSIVPYSPPSKLGFALSAIPGTFAQNPLDTIRNAPGDISWSARQLGKGIKSGAETFFENTIPGMILGSGDENAADKTVEQLQAEQAAEAELRNQGITPDTPTPGDAQLNPASMRFSQQLRMPSGGRGRPGMFGLQGFKDDLGMEPERHAALKEKLQGNIEEVGTLERERLAKLSKAEAESAEAQLAIAEKTEERAQYLRQEQENIEMERTATQEAMWDKKQRLDTAAKYHGMAEEDIETNMNILNATDADGNPQYSPQERALAKTKLDKAQKIGERSWGKTIAQAIMLGLGAFGASVNKTRNFAADTLNTMIERDVQSQMQNKVDREKRAKETWSDYDRAMNIYDKRSLGVKYAMANAYKRAQGLLDVQAAKLGIAKTDDRYLAQKNALLEAENKWNEAFEKEQFQVERDAVRSQIGVATTQAGLARQDRQQDMQYSSAVAARYATATRNKETNQLEIPGLKLTGNYDDKTARKVQAYMSTQAELEEVLKKMVKLREEYGAAERLKNKAGVSDIARQLKAYGGVAQNLLRKKTGSGANVTEQEAEAMDPDSWLRDPLQLGHGVDAYRALLKANAEGVDGYLKKMHYNRTEGPNVQSATAQKYGAKK